MLRQFSICLVAFEFLVRHDFDRRHHQRDPEWQPSEDWAQLRVIAVPTFAPNAPFLSIGAQAGTKPAQSRKLDGDRSDDERPSLAASGSTEQASDFAGSAHVQALACGGAFCRRLPDQPQE
jgi:hypothetical protein